MGGLQAATSSATMCTKQHTGPCESFWRALHGALPIKGRCRSRPCADQGQVPIKGRCADQARVPIKYSSARTEPHDTGGSPPFQVHG